MWFARRPSKLRSTSVSTTVLLLSCSSRLPAAWLTQAGSNRWTRAVEGIDGSRLRQVEMAIRALKYVKRCARAPASVSGPDGETEDFPEHERN